MSTTDFELQIWPDVNLVSVTRRFIEEVYEKVLDNLDGISRMALAVHELLENAVKYNAGGPMRLHIVIASSATGDRVTIRVSNQAAAEDVAVLREAFAEMALTADPLAYYQTLMRRNAKREGSGLGLARIKAEAAMSLRFEYDDGRVSLEAEAEFERGMAA